MPPSTRRSRCCRSWRCATAGTSAGCRRTSTRRPGGRRSSSTTATRAASGSRARGSSASTHWSATRTARSPSARASRAARRACSRRRGAPSTSRCTSRARSRSWPGCSRPPDARRLAPPAGACKFRPRNLRIAGGLVHRRQERADRSGMGSRMRGCTGILGATAAVLAGLVPAAAAYAGGTPAPSATGGSEFGGALATAHPVRPVARIFTINPKVVVAPRLPRLRVRVDQPGSRTVRARLVFLPRTETGAIVRVDAGVVPTGKRVAVNWPAGSQLAPGRYLVRLHVRGLGNAVLARTARASGRTTVTVQAPPPPAPAPPPAAAPVAPGTGVFPVAGPHTYGDGFGAPRNGYAHQGQDVPAAEGVPVVAPIAGTILYVDNQPGAAGWYVVQRGADGRDFFYAHCQAGSVAVAPGAAVTPGQQLCNVGATGDATGPHPHFEIWLGGGRGGAAGPPRPPPRGPA